MIIRTGYALDIYSDNNRVDVSTVKYNDEMSAIIDSSITETTLELLPEEIQDSILSTVGKSTVLEEKLQDN
ncbi:hypothetical protein CN931_24030 [Bacillus sp. AFS054943]|uniref:Uncharacterized protein n=1 Tax=Bacillus cereus TaxID=1396 RepID=A0A2C1LED5_BACCE|nr:MULTISPECIES: hypothetical protein [Bacillus]MBE7123150.1 hypothetical protein [Bacillus cereus]PGL78083.1 hypothetical protein CN931_24030 [Bacillus sp. AFS054943]PGT96633.1 hypothetical protein COD19_27100 [Bacillus cereus]TKI35793.1 hypothetical protein FC700_24800 [Bacillus mycoides]